MYNRSPIGWKSLPVASGSYAGRPSTSVYPSSTFRTKTDTEGGGSRTTGYSITSVHSTYAVYWRIIGVITSRIIGFNSSIDWMTYQTLSFKEQSVYGTPFQETLWSVTRNKERYEILRRRTNKIINNINVDFGLIRSMSRDAEFCNGAMNWIRRLIILSYQKKSIEFQMYRGPVATCRSFATTVSELKICDFSGETFQGFEVL